MAYTFLNVSGNFELAIVLASLLITRIALPFILMKRRSHKTYEKVACVKFLSIYPFKSLPGIDVDHFEIDSYGCKYGHFRDRMWILRGQNGRFISCRQEPSLALISTQIIGENLVLNAPNMKTLKLGIISDLKQLEEIKVWNGVTKGVDCGNEAANWFEQYLKSPGIRVLQYVTNCERPAVDHFSASSNEKIIYQDGSEVNVLSEASLDDLNTRLKEKVSRKNFRPNIFISGPQPYDEDNWKRMKIGSSVELGRLEACPRCIMTTINPEKGVKNLEMEPLKTLRSYRLAKNPSVRKILKDSPMFAIDCYVISQGNIMVGDEIFAEKDNFFF